jgi:hypothetical protein
MLTSNLNQWVAKANQFERLVGHSVDPTKDYFISISGHPDEAIETPIKANTHYLSFFDCAEDIPQAFNDTQALRLARFINEVQTVQGNLWVNCHAGISRSGAVVDILLRLGWTEHRFTMQERRFPNPRVWGKLAKHFTETRNLKYPMKDAGHWEIMIDRYLNPQRHNHLGSMK